MNALLRVNIYTCACFFTCYHVQSWKFIW